MANTVIVTFTINAAAIMAGVRERLRARGYDSIEVDDIVRVDGVAVVEPADSDEKTRAEMP